MGSNRLAREETPEDDKLLMAAGLARVLPLEIVVQRSFDACILINEDQIIMESSPKAYDLFQYEPGSLLGQSLDLLIPPALISQHQQHVEDFLTSTDSTRLMHERLRLIHGRRRDGSLFPLEAVIAKASLPTENDHFVMAVFVRDISARQRQLKEIEASAQFSQGVLDSQPAHICVLDEEGLIVAVNKSWQMFAQENGTDPDRVGVGVNYLTVSETAVGLHAEEGQAVAAGIRAVIRGELQHFTYHYPCHSLEEQRWFVVHVRPMSGVATKRIVVVHENVTHLKKTEAAFLQAQKAESLSLFAASIAHDFNNMITAVMTQSSLGLLRSGHVNDVKRIFNNIMQVGEQAAQITKQLMDYSGGHKRSTKVVDLNKLIDDTLLLMQTAVSHTISLNLQLANQSITILAEPGQLQQIMMNLVLNGAQACPGGIGVIQLQTELVAKDALDEKWIQLQNVPLSEQYACLRVIDNGQGMDAMTQTKIFDPFFTTKETGHGLGLAAVQGIVRSLNGFITVKSQPGKGTTFEVYFPYAEQAQKVETGPLAEDSVNNVTQGLILLADDEEFIRTAAAEYLEIVGYRVVTAVDGGDALRQFEAQPSRFVLAILDVVMPHLTGYQVYEQISIVRPDLPVIIISGYDNTNQRHVLDKENVMFVHKPYRFSQLMAAISQLVPAT